MNKVNSYYLGTVNDNEETDGMYFVGHLDLTGKLKIIRIHEAKQNDHSTEFHKTLIRANNLLSGIDLYIGDVYYSDSISVSLVTKSLHSNLGIATFKDYQLLTELSNYYLGYRQLSDTLKSFMAK